MFLTSQTDEFIGGWSLCAESIHQMPVHVGEPVAAALELERRPSVVDAPPMQHRRVQVMNVHRVARNVVAEIVRLAVSQSGLDAAPTSQIVKQRG